MTTPVHVDIWSDIACPWCYIGKRRFEAGVAAFDGDVTVTYHSFELAPDTPVDFEGSAADFLSQHKGMPREQVEQMLQQVTAIARGVGLDYDLDAVHQTTTLLAHQSLHHAREQGRQLELVERLFEAYFVEGRHVGKVDELVALGADAGLDAGELRAALEDDRYVGAVAADLDQARAYGIRGVPFYVIGGRYGVSGAQRPEVFTQALTQVRQEQSQVRSS
ncbi:DsbA family oxidoreductase [Georgenia satyanarayanai]|uniref:DsbA family oxidoreductase n=1 Tax=Georgenia satyanarayanai TaxID=860221 RepID=UPI0012640F51|nr:DsbA family oxidoreductase [Georgenia satyanarayanai]